MPQVVLGAALFGGAVLSAGSIAALTGIALSVAQIGIGLIISGVLAELAPSPDFGGQGRTITVREPVAPRQIVYGRSRKGGVVVFLHMTGATNEYMHLVIAIAGHRLNAINAIYFDGKEVVDASGTISADYTGYLFVEKKLGDPDQAALSQLQIDAPDKWTADHRLRGIAHVHLRLLFNPDKYPNGIPNIAFDVEGRDDIYDPRTLTTGYSENAALCLANYMADPLYGIGATIGAEDGVNTAALIEAANVCDEDVALAEGGTEKRYLCNGVVETSYSPRDVISGMLTAMAGRVVWPAGAWDIQAGAYRTPVVAITDDDIRSNGLTLTTRVTRSQNFNGVRGKFLSPDNDWQIDDFPAYQSATYVAEDQGEEVWNDATYPFTISAATTQRLAKIAVETVRRQQRVRLAGKLSAYRVKVGETILLSYARWGFTDKPFVVDGVTLSIQDGAMVPELILRETSPLVFSWSSSEQEIYAAAPTTSLPSPFNIETPGVPVLSEELYATRDGTAVRALIRVEWAAADSAFVVEYQIQGRRTLDAEGAATGDDWITFGRTDQLYWEVRDVAPGTWEIRVKAITVLGVSSAYATESIVALGLTAEPQDLTGVSIQTAGGLAVLKWDLSPDIDVRIGGRIVIRHSNSASPSWSNSVSLDEVNGNNTVAIVALKPGTYLLRARDNSGILGPVSTVQTKGATALAFVNSSTLTEDPTFSGTKTNCTVNGSSQLTISTVPTEGVYEFATVMDLGSVKAVRLRSDIDVAALNLSATIDDRLDLIDDWPDFDDTDGALTDVIVEVQVTDDDPSGSPSWSDWSRLDATEDEFRGARFRARLITESADYNVLVSGLSVYADEVA